MNSVFICSHIAEVCLCGDPANYLCDAPRPWRTIPEVTKLREQGEALAASHEGASWREKQLIEREVAGINTEMHRIMDGAPPEIRTCSMPICAGCALAIGEEEHLCQPCGDVWRRAKAGDDQRLSALRARGPGVMPADGWIVWGEVAHRLREPDDLKASCKRLVKPGWRPARDERRCKRCAKMAPTV